MNRVWQLDGKYKSVGAAGVRVPIAEAISTRTPGRHIVIRFTCMQQYARPLTQGVLELNGAYTNGQGQIYQVADITGDIIW